MRVKEIMTKSVFTITKDASVKECADLLEKHDVNGMPVMENDRVVGLITKADIFKSILPRYPEIFENEGYLMNFERIEERVNKASKSKIKDLMSTPPVSLNQNTSLVKAGSIMILKGIKQIPIVDNDKLVGIVTLSDICRALLARAER